MFKKEVVIDCHGHMLGRLAAVVAKELLNGQRIVLVRCERMNISGSLFRNKLKFEAFLRKKSNTNPSKGSHIHYRAPSKIVWRVVRGMLPHKLKRGKIALSNLKVYEEIPPEFEKVKRQVIPSALKMFCLKPHRRYCVLSELSRRVGWKHNDLINRLAEKRKARSAEYYNKKVTQQKLCKKLKKLLSNLSNQKNNKF